MIDPQPHFPDLKIELPRSIKIFSFEEARYRRCFEKISKQVWNFKDQILEEEVLLWQHHQRRKKGIVMMIPHGLRDEKSVMVHVEDSFRAYNLVHLVIVAEAGSSMGIKIERSRSARDHRRRKDFLGLIEVVQEPRSHLRIWKERWTELTNEISFHRAHLKSRAKLEWTEVLAGGRASKQSLEIQLMGREASTSVRTLALSKQNEQFDLSSRITHDASNTQSNVWTRGVLGGHSKIIAQGKICLQRRAIGASANLREDGFILNEGPEFDPIPELEVAQNNVQCSHGASASTFNDEQLFYLRSRGLSKDRAKFEIVKGFIASMFPIHSMFSEKQWDRQIRTLL